jgi:hypothetical protein
MHRELARRIALTQKMTALFQAKCRRGCLTHGLTLDDLLDFMPEVQRGSATLSGLRRKIEKRGLIVKSGFKIHGHRSGFMQAIYLPTHRLKTPPCDCDHQEELL